MKLIADNNTNVTNQLKILESLVTWPASFKKNIPANKNGCRALSIDFVGRAALKIQILYTCSDPNSQMEQTTKNGNKILIDGLGIVLRQFFDSDSEESSC